MKDIEDWCISRQLWWGHRIPAWYDENKKVYVGKSEAEVRKRNKVSGTLTRDEDVLDTWFSSQLWTFATLGWPKKPNNLQNSTPLPFWLQVLTSYFLGCQNDYDFQKFLKSLLLKRFLFTDWWEIQKVKRCQVKRKHNWSNWCNWWNPSENFNSKKNWKLNCAKFERENWKSNQERISLWYTFFRNWCLRLTFASLASGVETLTLMSNESKAIETSVTSYGMPQDLSSCNAKDYKIKKLVMIQSINGSDLNSIKFRKLCWSYR